MLLDSKEYIQVANSIEKLNNLDKHYYPKSIKESRYITKSYCLSKNYLLLFSVITKQQREFSIRELNTLNFNDYLIDKIGLCNLVETIRLNESYKKKLARLKKRINKLFLKENLFFLTFTFDDSKLKKKDVNLYKQNVLRKYVTQWLKKYTNDYVGNIDFGGLNGRIHFHCVVSSKANKIDGKSWSYGALNFEKIVTYNDKAISIYVNKLCLHAIKESTKRQSLIYPKKKS